MCTPPPPHRVRAARPRKIYIAISISFPAKRINAKYTANIEGTRRRIEEEGLTIEEAFGQQGEKFERNQNGMHYRDLVTGQGIRPKWSYNGAKYAWRPSQAKPEEPPVSLDVVVIPPHLAEEVAVEAEEMELKERFILEKIRRGASIVGNYPPDESTLAEYRVWKEARAK